MNRFILRTASALFIFIIVGFAGGQEAASPRPELTVRRTDKPIIVDGVLDDEAWQDAEAWEGYFHQQEPLDRAPSSEKTRVMVLQNDRMIYFGFQCYDSEPEKIFASSMRRDTNYGSGDLIELLIDTFQDNRNCYAFDVNPLGSKGDAIISDQGNHVNKQWECVIYMDGARNEQGWAAEFGIPFKSIKFKSGEVVDWKINITREIKHRQEKTYFAPIPREWGHLAKFRGELFATLKGIRPPKHGLHFEVYPYLLAGRTTGYGANKSRTDELNAGVDFKYDITTQLALDLTYKTDFAQAESEEEIVNVTRFNILRQEKRDFFLQNAGLFQFGIGSRSQSNFSLFDSRTIGIQDRQRLPLWGGGKLSGRVGRTSIAALTLQSEQTTLPDGSTRPATTYSAVRLKQDISKNSHVGMMVLNQEAGAAKYSRAVGVDGLWNVTPMIRLDASAARSLSPEQAGNDLAGDAGFILNKEWIDIALRYTHIDSLFNPQMGFVRRANIRSSDGSVTLTKWVTGALIQSMALTTGATYVTDHRQILQTRTLPLTGSILFKRGDRLDVSAVRSYEFVPQASRIRDIRIEPGIYQTWAPMVGLTSYRARPIYGSLNVQWGELFDGRQRSAALSGTGKVSNHLLIDLAYAYNHLELGHGELDAHVVSTRWTYSFTPDFFAKAYLQWNSADRRFSANFIIDYAYRPRSHIYLVYNENQNTLTRLPTDRIIMLKMTYLRQI